MIDGYIQHFEGLLNALHAAEAKEKQRYNNAIDIEDMAEATAVTIDARTKILKLRKCIEDFHSLNADVATIYPVEPLETASIFVSNESTSHKIEEPSQMEIGEIDSSASIVNEDVEDNKDIFAHEDINIESLDANVNPSEFSLFGKTYSFNDVGDFIITFCEIVILHRPYKFAGFGLRNTSNERTQIKFGLEKEQIAEPRNKLSNGFFVNTSGTMAEIKTLCKHILVECGYNAEALIIR